MKLSRRTAWLLILLGVGLFLGLIFRAFILTNVVVPIAALLLLFWRLLLSVHQMVYWGLVIGLAVGLIFYRLIQVAGHLEEPSAPVPDSVLKSVDDWRIWLRLASDEGPSTARLKQELRHKLVAMYAAKQPEVATFVIYEALRSRQLPLPDKVYNLLFGDEMQETELSWRQRLEWLAGKPGKWLRHWTGRDKADYYQAVEEVLTFMESFMEIKHGDDYFDISEH